MKKQVVIHTLSLYQRGQRIHDQISLPNNAIRITGVHQSLIMKSPNIQIISDITKDGLFFRQTLVVGDLRMQTFTKENWFYAAALTIQDRNLFLGDMSIVGGFFPHPATHSPVNFTFQSVNVNASGKLVHLYFRDRWGVQLEKDIEYEVKIYLELEIENKKDCL